MNQFDLDRESEEGAKLLKEDFAKRNGESEPVAVSCKQNLLTILSDGTVLKRKCYFIQFLLSSAFGPLGLLYSSGTATLVMIVVSLFIIIMVNTSYTDAPAILYYGTAYVVILIANALSVLVGFFTVHNYNNQRITEHTNLIKAIIECMHEESYRSDHQDITVSNSIESESTFENSSNSTLNSILWIIASMLVIGFLIYKSNHLNGISNDTHDNIQSNSYEDEIKNDLSK